MDFSGSWQLLLSNLIIDATISGSVLIVIALILDRYLAGKAAIRRNDLWRLVTVGLLLALFAAALPRMPLGLIPATSAIQWAHQSASFQPDFHELSETSTPPAGQVVTQGRSGPESLFTSYGWVCFLWLAGVLFAAGRLFADMGKVRRLAKQAKPLAAPLICLEGTPSPGKDLARDRVQVLLARCDITPMSWGWRRPKILLPKASEQWSEERRQLVLRHEWGHILQNDFPYLLLSRVAVAVFWFNPLVWLAAKHLARAREQACDDYVLESGVKASTYADHLLDIARAMRHGPKIGQANLSMARMSELEGRLMAVLDRQVPRGRRLGRKTGGWSLTGLLAMLPLLAVTPWKPTPSSVIGQADQAKLGALNLSEDDWDLLEREGVTTSFLERVVAFGYRHLDASQILALRHAGIEEAHLDRQADLIFKPLERVVDASRICMRADELVQGATLAVEIEGKTYYALPRCSLLMHRRGFRMALDPISGNKVDKAEAVIGVTADNHIFYFENENNFLTFNSRK